MTIANAEVAQVVWKLVMDLVQALADDPDAVDVEVTSSAEDMLLVTVRVADRDLGKVIGKQGRTARSLRTILGALTSKLRVHCTLNILESVKADAGVSA